MLRVTAETIRGLHGKRQTQFILGRTLHSRERPLQHQEDARDHDSTISQKQHRALDATALGTLFESARTANAFLPKEVPPHVLTRMVELAQLGPTSANCLPMRVLFVTSKEAKARLIPSVRPGNASKVTGAPVTAICAADLRFYEHFPRLFPHRADFGDRFAGESNAAAAAAFAWDNALFQIGYLIVAARAVGLDAGPLGGFDRAGVDKEFFADGRFKTQYLVNFGYGDDSQTFDRLPRFEVAEVATII